MENNLKNFPDYIINYFLKIPIPERENVLEKAGINFDNCSFFPEESDIKSLDEAIRYKSAKIQLVTIMLEGMIEDDINDRLTAKELASELINKYPLSEVIKEYEKNYRQKKN